MTKRVALFLFFFISSLAFGAYPNGYTFRRSISLNHLKTPNTDQADFPVLISGTYSYLGGVGSGGGVQSANGFDIIFTSDAAGQNRLDHEIDTYESATGKVNLWVRVPTVSYTTDTVIYLWYGNASISTSQENKTGVWSNHYVAVYHFGNGTTLSTADSTTSANTLTNSSATAAAGKIGGATTTSSSGSKYLYNATPTALPTGTSPRTIEAWIKQSSTGNGRWIAGYGNYYNLIGASTLYTYGKWNGSSWQGVSSSGTNDTTNWHFFASTLSSPGAWANVANYFDGVVQTSTAELTGSLETTGANLYIGRQSSYNGNYWEGSVDEVRISDVARSFDWLTAEYNNQSSPSTFYTIGQEAAFSGGPELTSISPNAAPIGTLVTIKGAGFGASQGTSSVTFNGTTAAPSSWSEGSISVAVPVGASTGPVQVVVNGSTSNQLSFSTYQAFSNSYRYRRLLTLDHTKVFNSDQANFPILITGTFAYLANVANGGGVQNTNGYDIIFTSDANGQNPLDYEVDGYDSLTGKANFWVRIPTLSHTADTSIYVWYGNLSISTSQGNRAGVWSNHYVAVYHFGNGSNLLLSDSSSSSNALVNNSASITTGKFGGGIATSGSGTRYAYATTPTALPTGTTPRTVEAWYKQSSTGMDRWIAGYGSGPFNLVVQPNNVETFGYWTGSSWQRASSNAGSDANWHFFASTLSSPGTWANVAQYLDGTALSTSASASGSLTTTGAPLYIGRDNGFYANYFEGAIDEVRISDVARSLDWLKTQYNNQSSPATFYSAGAEVAGDSAPHIDTVSPSSGPVGTGVTINGAGFGATQGSSTLTLNGTIVSPTNWSATQIIASIPAGASSGPMQVSVNGLTSNAVTFTVYQAFPNSFRYRRAVWIEHTKVPNTDQADFPVLVNGTFPFLANTSYGGGTQSTTGFDIVFTSDAAGQNRLDHEIDAYDSVTGKATFWVRVPSVSHTADTIIFVWYGNPAVSTSRENRAGVWSNHYVAVYHFGDGVSLSTGDASSSSNNLTNANALVTNGIVNGGVATTASSGTRYLYNTAPTGLPTGTAPRTLEAWYKQNSTGMDRWIAGYGSQPYNLVVQPNNVETFGVWTGSSWQRASSNAASDANWHFFASTLSSLGAWANVAQYLDGTALSTSASASGSLTTTGNMLYIGRQNSFDGNYLEGSIDEVRISDVARSADWIATEYNNQSSPSTFTSFGGELDTGSPVPIATSVTPDTGYIGATATITGSGFGATQGRSIITVGGVLATPTNWSDNNIVIPVPVGANTGNVVVKVNGIASNGVLYTVLPSVVSLSPNVGSLGRTVTVSGSSFGASKGGSIVKFNDAVAVPSAWSEHSITVPVPFGARTGPVSVNVGGVLSSTLPFTVNLPTVTSAPSSGLAGDTITVSGSGFGTTQGSSTITFNGVAGATTSWNDTSVVVVVPPGATTGDLVVSSNNATYD